MISHSTPQPSLEGEPVALETIELSSDAIYQAVHLAQPIVNLERQWQTYLNTLALFGFEDWLAERSSQFRVNRDRKFDPATVTILEAAYQLNVNGFNLYVIAQGSLIDDRIYLPRTVVDIPEFIPHFYVLVEVEETEETAVVQGFISYPQLISYRDSLSLTVDEDWIYAFPLDCFNANPDHLLLELQCLNPSAISLPPIPGNRRLQLSEMRSQLESQLSQVHSLESELWQYLTWEQATIIFTQPELRHWLYRRQTQLTNPANLQASLSHLLNQLSQNVINVGRWLHHELDELAQELSWQLLPSLTPATGLRSPIGQWDAIAQQLNQHQVKIPPDAQGAFHRFQVAEIPLHLYAITWFINAESVPEWVLLLILGTESPIKYKQNLNLRISDPQDILLEQELLLEHTYFFTHLFGKLDETFWVTIGVDSDDEYTLPPLGFQP